MESLYEWVGLVGSKTFGWVTAVIGRIIVVMIVCLTTLWLAFLMYACFTYIYMPHIAHEQEIFFTFE